MDNPNQRIQLKSSLSSHDYDLVTLTTWWKNYRYTFFVLLFEIVLIWKTGLAWFFVYVKVVSLCFSIFFVHEISRHILDNFGDIRSWKSWDKTCLLSRLFISRKKSKSYTSAWVTFSDVTGDNYFPEKIISQ